LEETPNANYPDYTQIYMDGSKMEERAGCTVITLGENKEIRIFNAEAEAINTAISITRITIQPKRVILSFTALDEIRKIDRHAKATLQGETNKNHKTVAEDWKNWKREKQERIRQAEWTSSDNSMVTVKQRIKKNNGTQALMRRDQVIISRLRMGYTQLTHGFRVDLSSSPERGNCGARLTVDHLLWDCPTLRRQRI
jgi:hypothetical protein